MNNLDEQAKWIQRLKRQLRYYYLRIIRLRGQPHELALGMALGVFSGMLPILPFQTALAITLAIFFKGSKITAALGTWVSNPFNWYFLYYVSYRIGARLLGLSENNRVFASLMASIEQADGGLVIVGKIMGAGGTIVAAFLLGGLLMALITAPIAYVVFLRFFRFVRAWRRKRKDRDFWEEPEI